MSSLMEYGYSSNPEERLLKHNFVATKSTRNGKPWTLVYTEKYNDKTSAVKRERQIKKMKSRKYIEGLLQK